MQKQIKFKKNLIFKRVIFLIMLVIAFYIIFNFSSQDGEISGSLSKKVTEFMVKVISKIKTMDSSAQLHLIEKLHPIIRKLAHFGVYTVVGFSIMGFMCTFDIIDILKILISFVVGVIFAVSDEIHQYYIPGRNASIIDVGIDTIGIITGIFILIFFIIICRVIKDFNTRIKKREL